MLARAQRGITLVEALVALLVMSFGTVALLGVQAKLRMNSDIARQRTEAVRLAQESLEAARSFGTLAEFEALASSDAESVDDLQTNTVFNRTVTVDAGAMERERIISVEVAWADRTGEAQAVRLMSSVHGVPAALAGSLAVAAGTSAVGNPGQRHPAIPRDAEMQSDGTSVFAPPGGGAVRWTFDNASGFITRTCLGESCTDINARLLAGYVRFATSPGQPSGDDAETPPSPKPASPLAEVQVAQTAPGVATIGCFEDQSNTGWVAYYCAVPLGLGASWSGRSTVINLGLASSVADTNAVLYRVCRYTPLRSHAAAPAAIRNEDHPLDYVGVDKSLVQQNFLVIRAGNGTAAFECPDDTDSDLVFARTWHHQPAN